ncbi:MAG: 30S ribosomal protein S5 [Candidatus Omnitrophica bacterium]|nr:30S ribosomal protein S5 [Candidatus Omnitrophota bacterium]
MNKESEEKKDSTEQPPAAQSQEKEASAEVQPQKSEPTPADTAATGNAEKPQKETAQGESSPAVQGASAPANAAAPAQASVAKPAQAGQRSGRGVRRNVPQVAPGTVIKDPTAPEVLEKVIEIKRITKVTKGGKKLSFSALVVVGDTMGKVGYSLSKASEVSIAIRKAMATAKKNMVKIPMRGTTIPHEIIGECSGAEVLLKPAGEGTGVIASGPVRAVCDGAGIHNILTKCHRSNNPINVVKATFDGLLRLKTVRVREESKI